MQEEHEPSPGLFGIKPKKKLRWRKREPDPKRRFRPRREEAVDTSKAKGEYTTQKMLAVMTHIVANVNEKCTAKEIAKGVKLHSKKRGMWDAEAALKILRQLAKRVLVEKVGGKKAKGESEMWTLTRAGQKHLWTELEERYYTPMIKKFREDMDWKGILHVVVEIRVEIVPAVKALIPCAEHAHAIYRIDLLWRTRSLSYLRNLLKFAPKAFNPAAYFVSSCLGSLWECGMKRARGWAKKRLFFVQHPELLEMFLETINNRKKDFVDPFDYAVKAYNLVETACRRAGYTPEVVSGVAVDVARMMNGPRRRKTA